MTLRIICAGLCALGLAASSLAATEYVEGEAIVTFKKSADLKTAQTALAGQALSFTKHFAWLSAHRQKQTGLVRDRTKTTAALMAELQRDPAVETAEPNYLRWTTATPNDPLFPQLWALQNTGQTVNGTAGTSGDDIKFVDAWNLAPAATTAVVVAVIDTGVDYTHPDLASNMWTNPGTIPNDPYTGDYYGYDFVNGMADPMDSGTHGTHVAGTIAATGNNHLGVIGVNFRAKIMALKASSNGLSFPSSALIEAIQYATLMKTGGVNIAAINASLGGGGSNTAESAAIRAAGDAGIIFCAAAGNSSTNNDLTPFYPASYRLPNMLVVAATDQNDGLADFSDYGATTVDLAAPGVNILSAKPLAGLTTTASVQQAGHLYAANELTYSGITTGFTAAVYDCGLGYPSNFPPAVRGNIALIQRGTLLFSNKVGNAMAAGARAAIIYNNTNGNFLGTLIIASNWIPAVSLSQADGQALLAALPTTATVINNHDATQLYQLSDGTSMATPHVAGAVAFAAMNYPSETVSQRLQRLLASVDPVPGLHDKVRTGGRLNLLRTLTLVDATPPAVTITSPASGTIYTSAQTVTLTAMATDNLAVARVEFYDGATWQGADTGAPFTHDWTFTRADNGVHNWTARAYDAANNIATSAVVALTVNIPCTYALAVNTVAVGARATNGTVQVLAGAGCPWTATNDVGWLTVTAGGTGTGSGPVSFTVDDNCSPTPRSGTLTVAGQTLAVNQEAGLALAVPSALVGSSATTGRLGVMAMGACSWTATSDVAWLSIESATITNGVGTVLYRVASNTTSAARIGAVSIGGLSFTVTQAVNVAQLAGTYHGLALPANAITPATAGALKVVLGKTGGGAANLSLGSKAYTFQPRFDVWGDATNTVLRSGLIPLQVMLHLDVWNNTEQITGTVADHSTFTASLLADRAPTYGAAHTSPWAGTYSCLLWPTTNALSVPQGIGFGTLVVGRTTGVGALAGRLADGTTFQQSKPVSKFGTWPLYANNGTAIGWLGFSPSNTVGAAVAWFKSPAVRGRYAAGFNTTLALTGTKLAPPAGAGTWQLTLAAGDLTNDIVNTVTVTPAGTVTLPATNTYKLTLKITLRTGKFTGSFVHPASKKTTPFTGLFLQAPENDAGGFFLGPTTSGAVTLEP